MATANFTALTQLEGRLSQLRGLLGETWNELDSSTEAANHRRESYLRACLSLADDCASLLANGGQS